MILTVTFNATASADATKRTVTTEVVPRQGETVVVSTPSEVLIGVVEAVTHTYGEHESINVFARRP